MLIIKYFALTGTALAGLLYVADAHLPKGASPVVTSQSYGLPQPWKPERPQTVATISETAEFRAPETTGSSSEAEPAADRREAKPLKAATTSTRAAENRPARKVKVAAAKRRPASHQQRYALQREQAPDTFGGFFGRF